MKQKIPVRRAATQQCAACVSWMGEISSRAGATVSVHTRPIAAVSDKIEELVAAQIKRLPVPAGVCRLYRWLANHPVWAVAILATSLSIAAYTWYSMHGLTLAYTDALNHMAIARRVVAGRTPGLAKLGSVWLPLHHLLMVPLLVSATLYHDGFAGAFPSMVAYVIGSIYMHRTGRLLLGSLAGGWMAALVFALNPNVLYMQSTAMTESDMLAAAIVTVYYLLQWSHEYRTIDLLKASAAVAAGTLVRYDAWALALASAALLVYLAWRRYGRVGAEGCTILYGLLAFAGCAAWFIYNGVIFHDPLYFYSGMYSTQAQQKDIEEHAGLPTHNHPWLSFHVYGQAVIDTIWWPLAILALLGLLYWLFRARLTMRTLPGYLAFVPLAFNVLALVRGISIIVTPEIPFGVPTYFNVRYGMMMIPAMALCLAFLAIQRRVLLAIVLALVVIFGIGNSTLSTPASTPYVLRDPLYGVGVASRETGIRGGKWLADHYRGGNVLITYSHDSGIIFWSQLPDTDFITEANGYQFRHAVAYPQDSAAWIVLSPAGGNNEIGVGLDKQPKWSSHYILRHVIGGTLFYERIGDP